MQFEQIKAITEKYGPVLEQLDRLVSTQWAHGSVEYLTVIGKLKLVVADQFVNEVRINERQAHPTEVQQQAQAMTREA